jgi:hypothetical protein
MSYELLTDKSRQRGRTSIAIYPGLKRLSFSQKGYELLEEHHGEPVNYVQVLLDREHDRFLVKPCTEHDPGSKKLNGADATKGFSRFVHVSTLLKSLKNPPTQTIHAKIEWDQRESAARVDLGSSFGEKVDVIIEKPTRTTRVSRRKDPDLGNHHADRLEAIEARLKEIKAKMNENISETQQDKLMEEWGRLRVERSNLLASTTVTSSSKK